MKLRYKILMALFLTVFVALSLFSYLVYLEVQKKTLIPLIGHRMDLTARNAAIGVKYSIIEKAMMGQNFKEQIKSVQKTSDYKESIKKISIIKRQNELEKEIQIFGKLNDQEAILVGSSAMEPKLGSKRKIYSKEMQVLTEGLPLFGHEWQGDDLLIFGLSPVENLTADIIGFVRTEFYATDILASSSKDIIKILSIAFAVSFIIIVVIAWSFGGILTKQVDTLIVGAGEVAGGNLDIFLPIQTNDELGSLTKTFNSMTKTLKEQRDEIKEYSENLEKLVEERTRELNEANLKLQAMLDNLGEGIFLFSADFNIMPLYSKSALNLFGETFYDKSILDVLELTEKEREWAQMLFPELLPFKDLVPLGPAHKQINAKEIGLKFIPLRENDKIVFVMVVASDLTEEIAAKKKLASQEKSIHEMINIFENQSSYMSFISEAKNLITCLKETKDIKEEKNKLLYSLHTLKGGALLFGHNDLADVIHRLEDDVSQGNNLNFDEMDEKFDSVVARAKEYFGQEWEPGEIMARLVRSKLIGFKEYIKDESLKSQYREAFLLTDLGDELSFLKELCLKTAQRNNKNIAPLKITGDKILFYPEPYRDIVANLVHPLNNAIIHGIEESDEREATGKNTMGQISIHLKEESENYLIEIVDDGRGMDSKQTGSSLKSVSIDAGRGVGKDSLKEAVLAIGGHIHYTSKKGFGVRVSCRLPILFR